MTILDPSLRTYRTECGFFLHESCGKCIPCREGLRQAEILIKKIIEGDGKVEEIETLDRYTRTIQCASFCGLGQAAGNSLASSLTYYKDEYLSNCKDFNADGYGKEAAS